VWRLLRKFDANTTGGSMELNQDFREFFQSLNANRVRYLVVGGFAVALHGHPRYTKDIDVWIDCSAANAKRMVRAIAEFGFASLGLKAADFQEFGQVVQLGIAPNRIDILMSLQGVNFNRCYKQRVTADFGGIVVNFIDVDSLKINKRSTGRAQDRADVENLETGESPDATEQAAGSAIKKPNRLRRNPKRD
jgi:hypothetical protein